MNDYKSKYKFSIERIKVKDELIKSQDKIITNLEAELAEFKRLTSFGSGLDEYMKALETEVKELKDLVDSMTKLNY